jgi:indole-3-glycerol phosphate synthase
LNSFLDKVCNATRKRVEAAKAAKSLAALKKEPLFARKPRGLRKDFARDDYNIIAEIKFASPSEGRIRDGGDPLPVAEGYLAAGARMLSVLTEPVYFGGSLGALARVREAHPDALLLRKDFILDPYQLVEARAAGADAALLIAALTGKDLTAELLEEARALDLTPLVEVHDEAELETVLSLGAEVIGVNNRNLKTLKTDLGTSRRLAARKPKDALFICESGLKSANDLQEMRKLGFDGFLMGTHFMKAEDPGAALAGLRKELACG